MSDYESHTGKLRIAEPMNNETFEEKCKRLWVENGKSIEDYDKGELFCDFYNKYLNVGGKIWEIFDHEDLGEEEDSFCNMHDNKDGTFSFHTRFYNGGTCLSEMLEGEVEGLNYHTILRGSEVEKLLND